MTWSTRGERGEHGDPREHKDLLGELGLRDPEEILG
jgi:hypothetical protein